MAQSVDVLLDARGRDAAEPADQNGLDLPTHDEAVHRGPADPQPKGGFLDIPARAIQKDNVRAFWDDLKQKTGKK